MLLVDKWPCLTSVVYLLVTIPRLCSFVNGGRGACVYGDAAFDVQKTSVHVLNTGRANVSASASMFGMGCGWRPDWPGRARERRVVNHYHRPLWLDQC